MEDQIRLFTAVEYTSPFFEAGISENDGESSAVEQLVIHNKRDLCDSLH